MGPSIYSLDGFFAIIFTFNCSNMYSCVDSCKMLLHMLLHFKYELPDVDFWKKKCWYLEVAMRTGSWPTQLNMSLESGHAGSNSRLSSFYFLYLKNILKEKKPVYYKPYYLPCHFSPHLVTFFSLLCPLVPSLRSRNFLSLFSWLSLPILSIFFLVKKILI